MEERRKVELLSPAADLEVGIAAIDAGADSVYIGGPAFGARVRAGNSMRDVESLSSYAHRFGAKCYMTLNTLLYEKEIPQAIEIARQAYHAGVDALIIQDLGLIEAGLPPIDIHASTQCHIDTVEKAVFLESLGFSRLVLARELSLREIEKISSSVKCSIETFVHGALCVSYSGQCYMSCYMNGRSGNRGDCAQSCRLAYSLENAQGKVLQKDRYLLSMKDFAAGKHVEALIRSGVSCLKIEGRLKDASYVKNVTAYYRRELDRALENLPQAERSSQGRVFFNFEPDIQKTFHRPYTDFNLDGQRRDWAVFETPKASGEKIARVKKVWNYRPDRFSGLELGLEPLDPSVHIQSGDGLCYVSVSGQLEGGQVERAVWEKGLWRVWMQGPDSESRLPEIEEVVYRNQNVAFEKILEMGKTERKLDVVIEWDVEKQVLSMSDAEGQCRVDLTLDSSLCQEARDAEKARENFEKQMSRLGDTSYRISGFSYPSGSRVSFLPMATLNHMRRELVAQMDQVRQEKFKPEPFVRQPIDWERVSDNFGSCYGTAQNNLGYRLNVSNAYSEQLYMRCGVGKVEPAFELQREGGGKDRNPKLLMVCKHCIRFQLGQCLKKGQTDPDYAGDLFLTYGEYKFALKFDCRLCQMQVWSLPERQETSRKIPVGK